MSDVEYGDEEDEFLEDEWYDNPDDYVMTDGCPLDTMADPVFFRDPAQDEDVSDYEYESDHYYDGDEEDIPNLIDKRRPHRIDSRGVNTGTDSLSSTSVSSSKLITAPISYAHIDPGLTAAPRARYLYEPGHGEVVPLLKNWRQLFDQARPSKNKPVKRKGKPSKLHSVSESTLQASTTGFIGSNAEIEFDSDKLGIFSRENTHAAVVENELHPSSAMMGPLEIRPTPPLPHSNDNLPPRPTPRKIDKTTDDETLPARTSPSPPASLKSVEISGMSNNRKTAKEQIESREPKPRSSKKRNAQAMDASEAIAPSNAEDRPARRRKVSGKPSTNNEPAVTPRRSARNQNKK
ncbi:hypothetical protein KEM56_003475 [Ascosphaera pollenicola]|nr:hypothetical protein KEM56_003475 [Ascosphaera pollenicola]